MVIDVEIAVRAQARRGAAPTWDASSSTLLWVDAAEAVIHRSNPAAGTGESMVAPQPVGSVKPRMRGGLVANLQDGIALLDALGSRRWLVYWERAGFHAGEMAVDQLGRLLALSNPAAGSGGWLARVDGTGAAKVLAADLAGCGGVAFSPDGRLLYLTDTSLSTVDVYDYDVAAGEVSGRRRLSTVDGPGVPGAPCVDAAGCLWLPLDGGGAVRRYRPDGALDAEITLPVRYPTACCFGGATLSDLYVTTAREGDEDERAGSVLVLPDVAQGLPGTVFNG